MPFKCTSGGTACLPTTECPGRMASELWVGTPFVPQPLRYMQMYGKNWEYKSSKDLGNS